jgi:hypothetical protein
LVLVGEEMCGVAEQYALKQKRGFVGERLYILHFGDDGKSSREQSGFVWQNGIKPTGMWLKR